MDGEYSGVRGICQHWLIYTGGLLHDLYYNVFQLEGYAS